MKFKSFTCLVLLLCSSAYAMADGVNLQHELKPNIEKEQQIRVYKHDDGATITEYKLAGTVWMIKVNPAGDLPAYYLYDAKGDGAFERRIMGNALPSAPMWIIKRF